MIAGQPRRSGGWLLVLGCLLGVWPAPVEAGDRPAGSASAGRQVGARRPLPDYRGRPAAPPPLGEYLLWVPRIVFYPVHRFLDSFVRWPVLRLAHLAEEYHVFPHLKRIFIWRNGKAGAIPTFLYEFGLGGSGGVYLFHDDLLLPRHSLSLYMAFGGVDWLRFELQDQLWIPPGGRTRLSLRARYLRRPDFSFFGIGAHTQERESAFYLRDMIDTRAEVKRILGDLSSVRLHLMHRRVRFGPGKAPALEEGYALEQVPGFAGYSLLGGGVQAALDSRRPEYHESGSGVRLELFGSYRIDPTNARRSFIRWGGELAGMLDVSGGNHVLGLRSYLAFVDPLGEEEVPFSEMVGLGGRRRLRGYPPGRFRGLSAVELTASYRYPIWTYVDAELFVSVGNAFDRHLEGMSLGRMFLCWGLALRTSTSRNLSFDLLVGFGGNRLDSRRFALDSVNFAFGLHPGF